MGNRATATLALRGAKWATLGTVFERMVRLAAVMVLARLLVPEHFGLVSIASLVLALVNRLKTLGLHTALVQRSDDVQEAANACFLVNAALTIISFLIILGTTPLVARFFSEPLAGPVLAIMSLRLFFEAASAVQVALTVKALNFRKQTLILLAEATVYGIVAVTLAAVGWGVWALVAGSLAGSMLSTLLWWLWTPWRPTWTIDWSVARQLLRFGVGVWTAGNFSYLIDASSRILIGKFLGLTTLGHYEITSRLAHMPLNQLMVIGDRVAIPAFCREQEDLTTLGNWWIRLSGYLVLATALAAGILFLFADPLIPVLFGPQWFPAIGPTRALAPYALSLPLLHAWPVYIATGRAGLLLRLTVVRAAVTIALMVVAAHVSLVAVCAVLSASACAFAPINMLFAARAVGARFRDVLAILPLPLFGLTAFAAAAFVTRSVGGATSDTQIWSLLAIVPPTAVYLVAIALARPGIIGEFRSMMVLALGGVNDGSDPGQS